LVLDGVSVRIRLVGKVQRRVALCAYGLSEDGGRELIDFLIVKTESQEHWRSLLEELWRRGLRGTKLKFISTDGHAGLIAALKLVWPRVALQRCWAHKLRNVAAKLKRSEQECLQQAKLIYQTGTRGEAIATFRAWKTRWRTQAQRAVRCLEEDLEELSSCRICLIPRKKTGEIGSSTARKTPRRFMPRDDKSEPDRFRIALAKAVTRVSAD
jgi:putative transposase